MNLFLWSDKMVHSSKDPFQYPDSPYFWENFKNMEKETAALIEKLAAKLGTTTEYLWMVLIKQAPLDSTITLFQGLLIALFGWVLWKAHKKIETKDGYDGRSGLEYSIGMILCGLVFLTLSLAFFFEIPSVFYGFVNPEYWALQEILDKLK